MTTPIPTPEAFEAAWANAEPGREMTALREALWALRELLIERRSPEPRLLVRSPPRGQLQFDLGGEYYGALQGGAGERVRGQGLSLKIGPGC